MPLNGANKKIKESILFILIYNLIVLSTNENHVKIKVIYWIIDLKLFFTIYYWTNKGCLN